MNLDERFRRVQEAYAAFTPEQKQTFGEILIENLPLLTFGLAAQKLQSGEIVRYQINPQLQQDLRPGNSRVTLIDRNGQSYNVVARYDPTTNQIFPPL